MCKVNIISNDEVRFTVKCETSMQGRAKVVVEYAKQLILILFLNY